MAHCRFAQFHRRREIATTDLARSELNNSDTDLTRTGSANALRRNAIAKAASSSTGPAATGEQHIEVPVLVALVYVSLALRGRFSAARDRAA